VQWTVGYPMIFQIVVALRPFAFFEISSNQSFAKEKKLQQE
jgi:hypothetical protein